MKRTVDRVATKKALLADHEKPRGVMKRWPLTRGINDDSFKAYFYYRLREGTPTTIRIEYALKKAGYLRYRAPDAPT